MAVTITTPQTSAGGSYTVSSGGNYGSFVRMRFNQDVYFHNVTINLQGQSTSITAYARIYVMNMSGTALFCSELAGLPRNSYSDVVFPFVERQVLKANTDYYVGIVNASATVKITYPRGGGYTSGQSVTSNGITITYFETKSGNGAPLGSSTTGTNGPEMKFSLDVNNAPPGVAYPTIEDGTLSRSITYGTSTMTGSGTTITVGFSSEYDEGASGYLENNYYGMMKFNLSEIPSNAVINSATLILQNISHRQGSSTVTFKVRRITSSWTEASSGIPSLGSAADSFTGENTSSNILYNTYASVTNAVTELIQNGGYGLCIYLDNSPSSTSYWLISSRESGSSPVLYIDWYTPNTAPNAPVLGWSDGQVLNTRTPTVTWAFSDPDGNGQGSYYIEVINGSYTAPLWNSGWITDGNARSYTLPAGAIPSDGQCYIRMKVTDSHGAINQANGNGPDSNFGNRRLIIDTVAPTIASVSAQQFNRNANTPTRIWAYGLSDATSGVSYVTVFLVRPDGSYYQTNNGINAGNGNWYIDVTWNNDVQGNWGVDFRGVDAAGNTGNMVRAYVYVDSTPPTIASVQGYSYTNQSTGTRRVWAYGVTDSGSGINQVLCNYTVPGKSTVSSVNCTASGSDFFVDIPLSVQGEYKVDFYCVDKAGNWMSNPNSKTAYFFVDSQRPNDPDPNVTYGTTTALFSWKSFSDPSPSSGYDKTYMYLGEWNGSGWVGTPLYNGTNIGNVLTLSVSGLKQGTRYRYTVTQYDKTGNESSYTYKEFVTKRKIGEYRIQKSGQLLSLPVYDPNSGINGPKALRTAVTAGIGCLELVPINDVNASPIRLVTSQGVKAISK